MAGYQKVWDGGCTTGLTVCRGLARAVTAKRKTVHENASP